MPVVNWLRCVAREERTGARADCGQRNGNDKNRSKTAKRSIDEPERDGRQQDRTAGLDATIIPRGFAASFRRCAEGQQRITSGTESCPTQPPQGVSEHRYFRERNKAEKHCSG